jgi:hypothetical protein
MRDMHVERLRTLGRRVSEVRPQPSQTRGKLLRRADRRGRFEDYGIARDKDGRDRVCGLVDVIEIDRPACEPSPSLRFSRIAINGDNINTREGPIW